MAKVPVHRFAHEAMTTQFEVVVAGLDARYAGEAAEELFREIDRYERLLSRYDPASDVAQINRLRPGERTRVSVEVYECLQLAGHLTQATGGAFDVTCGPLLTCWAEARANGRQAPDPDDLAAARERVGSRHLQLHATPPESGPREFSVTLANDSPGVLLDLGAIGKGFALDGLRDLLRDWKIDNVLVHSGTSTALAFGSGPDPAAPAGWTVGVGAEWGAARGFSRARLHNAALSGSGVEVKGHHIVDPRSGQPVSASIAAWTLCPAGAMADTSSPPPTPPGAADALSAACLALPAATADALSTAFMVFTPAEAQAFARRNPGIWAMTVRQGLPAGRPTLETFGQADLLP